MVGLRFGFRMGIDRVALMAHKLPSFFDHRFGALAQLSRMLIQVIKGLTAALTQQFARFFAREQRKHQPSDGPQAQTQTDKQVREFDSLFVVINFPSFEYNNVETVWL